MGGDAERLRDNELGEDSRGQQLPVTAYMRALRKAERGGSTTMQAVPKSQPQNQPPPPPRSRLASVVKGRLDKPIRVVLYATDGLGKSTFASHAPSPIFIGAEDGTAQLDVARMPDIATWQDILDSVDELAASEHEYKTLVLDTADWAEPMCWAQVCAEAKKPDIESFGYGKGYTAALDQWRLLLSKFERARDKRGMHVIVLAHSVVRTFKNPEDVGDYDRYEMSLNTKAGGLLKQWADAVLFGAYETLTRKVDTNPNGRVKGIATGARLIHTQRRAAFDAKNRYDLPEVMPLDWDTFAEAVAAHRPADPAQLKARIAELLAGASDDIRTRVTAALSKVGDNAAELARIADKLAATVQIQETNS